MKWMKGNMKDESKNNLSLKDNTKAAKTFVEIYLWSRWHPLVLSPQFRLFVMVWKCWDMMILGWQFGWILISVCEAPDACRECGDSYFLYS
jgi:hypothetical protein